MRWEQRLADNPLFIVRTNKNTIPSSSSVSHEVKSSHCFLLTILAPPPQWNKQTLFPVSVASEVGIILFRSRLQNHLWFLKKRRKTRAYQHWLSLSYIFLEEFFTEHILVFYAAGHIHLKKINSISWFNQPFSSKFTVFMTV